MRGAWWLPHAWLLEAMRCQEGSRYLLVGVGLLGGCPKGSGLWLRRRSHSSCVTCYNAGGGGGRQLRALSNAASLALALMSVPDACSVHSMQEQQRLYGGLLMVRLLARKYEFKDDDEREPLAHIVSATFPALLAIFQVGVAARSRW